ncbi:hypothetical protein ACSFA0_19690 [Variovorax sp. LT1P1]|uniref:hypothetical protein n=1 Tax=Variovorax sp. LT1P1 TaxID=3443730 RepID=UPI003F47DA0B
MRVQTTTAMLSPANALDARRFLRNAGRDDRQRVERLYQVSLRKANVLDASNVRCQPNSMAGGAIATFVAPVVMLSISAVVMRANLGVCVVARGGDRITMIMVTAARRGGDSFH